MIKISGKSDATGKRIAVVTSRWNEMITKALTEGALETLASANANVTVLQVPGTWEIPVVIRKLMDSDRFDGYVALGCILQGATSHAGMLAGDVSAALMSLQSQTGIPIAWGVLTPENQEQALERSGMKLGNKGREAASALVETLSVLDQCGEENVRKKK